jgi:photosystem II stability/assembly factor-like uncharacterized protein
MGLNGVAATLILPPATDARAAGEDKKHCRGVGFAQSQSEGGGDAMKTNLYVVFLVTIWATSIHAQDGWQLQTSPLGDVGLGKVQFVSPTEGWIYAENGKLLHTTDAGATWVVVTPSPEDAVEVFIDPPYAMSFVSPTTGYLIGTLGSVDESLGAVLLKTTDSGATWSKKVLREQEIGWQVQFIDANNGWASTLALAIENDTFNVATKTFRTTDGGTTWDSVYAVSQKLYIFDFIDASNGWAIQLSITGDELGPPIEILRTTDAGATWSSQLTENNADGLRAVNSTTCWVVGGESTLLRTTDAGLTWVPIANTGLSTFSANAVFFLDQNTGWVGVQEHGVHMGEKVLRTTDGGASWSVHPLPPGFRIQSMYFIDANNGWIVSSSGEIARTTTGGVSSVKEEYVAGIPGRFELRQNYPNPFNPSTTIEFHLPSSGPVVLKVLDLLGREIETLLDGERRAGAYRVTWNASALPSGIYFYRLTAGATTAVGKMILTK